MSRLHDPMPGDEPSPSPCHQAGRNLVACPDCRREVSRHAHECVHCGRPGPCRSGGAIAVGAGLALLLGGLLFAVALVPRCTSRATACSSDTSWEQALRARPSGCGFLGVRMSAPAEISFVAPDSPAAEALLRPGDRIVAVDGRRVTHFREYLSTVWAKRPGERLTLSIERGGPAVWTVDVVLGRHPND